MIACQLGFQEGRFIHRVRSRPGTRDMGSKQEYAKHAFTPVASPSVFTVSKICHDLVDRLSNLVNECSSTHVVC